MEIKFIENPDLEVASFIIKSAIMGKELVILIGECRVDYEGRGASRLEPGERLVVIKQDGAVLVHRPTGYSPVNWQPASSVIEVMNKPGLGLVLHAVREKPREYLTIVFTKVSMLFVSKLRDSGDFTMYLDENEMRDVLVENPFLIEEGLKVIDIEKQVGDGYVDIYAQDRDQTYVLIELKRITATREAVLQLYKYIEAYKAEHGIKPRGVIIAPAFSPTALETALKLGLEYKSIDLKKLWNYVRKKHGKRASLMDYSKRM